MGINSIGGNFGFNFNKNVSGPINLNKTDNVLFNNKVNRTDGIELSKTPGNTGVAEATARGTLAQLDLIEKIGL